MRGNIPYIRLFSLSSRYSRIRENFIQRKISHDFVLNDDISIEREKFDWCILSKYRVKHLGENNLSTV